jgi:hypothetical protein
MDTWGHGDMGMEKSETWRHGDMATWTHRHGDMEAYRHGDLRHGHGDMEAWASNWKRKKEVQAIFLNLLTVCSSCKRKFAVCAFADKETNVSSRLQNGLYDLSGLARL